MEAKPDSYYHGTRDELLPFIPRDVGTVLEVGCADGNFGRLLKNRGAREVWGVEIVASVAEQARRTLDRVLIGDVTNLIDELPDAYFDLVVFNDVLEHMVDPYLVLTKMKSKVSSSGVVISSIPNIRYYPVLRELLLHKKWEYEESGILDYTHLRFFTVKSIVAMYERLGYTVLRHEGINPMPDRPLSYRLASTVLRGRVSDMQFIQFVTVARPTVSTSAASVE
jgi:SAM-dependent methyltransferase